MNSLGKAVSLPMSDKIMNVSIREENAGALLLSRTFPPKFTPYRKYYATKPIWFCEEIIKRWIKIFKIDIVDHSGDLFTKGLPINMF